MTIRAPHVVIRWWQRLMSPVPQDLRAVMFTTYRGKSVLMRPRVFQDRPWLVEEWIPDPDECRAVDESMSGREAPADEVRGDIPPALPATDAAPDFNPVGCGGL